jgi:hypothetical protein
MVKLPGLVAVVAEHDDRDHTLLAHIARVLREQGGLPTTKRGVGAADMGALEAAKYLTAAYTVENGRQAAQTVERFHSLVWGGNWFSKDPKDELLLFEAAVAGRPFGEALAGLISIVPELIKQIEVTLAEHGIADGDAAKAIIAKNFRLEVSWAWPRYSAEIDFRFFVDDVLDIGFSGSWFREPAKTEAGFYGTRKGARTMKATVSAVTLFNVAMAVKADRPVLFPAMEAAHAQTLTA